MGRRSHGGDKLEGLNSRAALERDFWSRLDGGGRLLSFMSGQPTCDEFCV